MRRADRLFQIVQFLRGGRLVTAAQLAERLEVSERTIYRDIADLQTNGVPIDGEAGVGYIMREGFDLPPLMFNKGEIAALIVGARMVQAWGGAQMAKAAEEALTKIEAVLPETERAIARDVPIHAFDSLHSSDVRRRLDLINEAIAKRQVIHVDYEDGDASKTTRALEPLGLHYWGSKWTLIAWCQLRQDYRMFRIDRFANVALAGDVFTISTTKNIRNYYESVAEAEGMTVQDLRTILL